MDEQAWSQLAGAPRFQVDYLEQPALSPVTAADAGRFDALLIKRNRVTA